MEASPNQINLVREMQLQAEAERAEYSQPAEAERFEITPPASQGKESPGPQTLTRDDIAPVGQWVIKKPPEIDWILSDMIPAGAVGVLTGMGGTGKSNLTLLMARTVATGTTIEPFRVVKPRPVLILNVEDSGDDMWRRLYAQAQIDPLSSNEAELIQENLMVYPGRGEVGPLMELDQNNPCRSPWGIWLQESVKNLKPALIILDTKSRLFGLDENSNDHASQWLSFIERVATDSKAAVLIVHHVAKARAADSNQLAARGASALIDNARFCFSLTNISESDAKKYDLDRPEMFFQMEMTKGNYVAPGKRWFFEKGEAGYPQLVNLEKGRLTAAAEMLLELLTELDGPVTWNELRNRPAGTEIRKALRTEHGITRATLYKIFEILIDSRRIKIVDILAEKNGQTRPEIHVRTDSTDEVS